MQPLRRVFEYKRSHIFVQNLNAGRSLPSLPGANEDAKLLIVTAPAQIGMLLSEGFDLSACPFLDNVKDGLNGETVLFFIFSGKTLVHSSLVTDDSAAFRYEPAFRNIRYKDAGYIGPCYTNPIYRGQGLYPYALGKICDFLKGQGKGKAFISTKRTNYASIRGIAKAGFSFVSEMLYMRLLFWKFCKAVQSAGAK